MATGYPTPDEFELTYTCRQVYVPDNPAFIALIPGLLAKAAKEFFWYQQGTMTTQQAAEYMSQAIALYNADGGCMSCDEVADCIETSEAVQTALTNTLSNLGYGGGVGTPDTPSTYNGNPTLLDGSLVEDCDNDMLFGAISQLITWIDEQLTDFFEEVEANSNGFERAAIIGEGVPISDTIGVDTVANTFDQVLEEIAEGYAAAFDTELADEYRCDIFCLVKDTCELDFQTVADYFMARVGASIVEDAFEDAISWFLIGGFEGTEIADAAFALVCTALAYASSFASIDVSRITSGAIAAFGTPSDDWILLCEDCNPDLFEPVISHNVPCSVAGQSCGTIVSNPSANVWRISSTHRAEGNDEGATIADVSGRLFKITGAAKVSGADITFSTRANDACATTSAAGLNLNNNIKNIIYVAPNTATWTYDFTFELVP